MLPTDAQRAQLKELSDHFSKLVDELSALERTINWYTSSIYQERQEIGLLSSRIAMLEIATLARNLESGERVLSHA